MADHRGNKIFPSPVINRIGDLVVDSREQHARFDRDSHQRGGSGLADEIDSGIELAPVITASLGHEIEVLLQEEANHARVEYGDLGHASGPNRIGGQTSLSQGNLIDLEGITGLREVGAQVGGGLPGGEGKGGAK